MKKIEKMFRDHPELAVGATLMKLALRNDNALSPPSKWLKQEIIKVVTKYPDKMPALIRIICTMAAGYQGKLYDVKYIESVIKKIQEIIKVNQEKTKK
jgi:hypothetical protein